VRKPLLSSMPKTLTRSWSKEHNNGRLEGKYLGMLQPCFSFLNEHALLGEVSVCLPYIARYLFICVLVLYESDFCSASVDALN
jgi:hypothetical protein